LLANSRERIRSGVRICEANPRGRGPLKTGLVSRARQSSRCRYRPLHAIGARATDEACRPASIVLYRDVDRTPEAVRFEAPLGHVDVDRDLILQ
jgi:hypothetical protein